MLWDKKHAVSPKDEWLITSRIIGLYWKHSTNSDGSAGGGRRFFLIDLIDHRLVLDTKIGHQQRGEQLNADIVTQVQTTMPDLPASILSSPSTVASLMQEEIATSTQKLDKLGSITADEPPVLTLVKNISESLPPHAQARIDVSEMVISKASINLKSGN